MPPNDPRQPSTGKIGGVIQESEPSFLTVQTRVRNADKPLTRRKRCRRTTWVPSDEMDFLQFRCDKFAHSQTEAHSETGIVKTTSPHGGLVVNYVFQWTESEAPLTIRGPKGETKRASKQSTSSNNETYTGPG